MRVTKRRVGSYPLKFEIRVNSKTIGRAFDSEQGPGWCVVSDEVPLCNSWADGLRYQSVMSAADAAVAYVKRAAKEQM